MRVCVCMRACVCACVYAWMCVLTFIYLYMPLYTGIFGIFKEGELQLLANKSHWKPLSFLISVSP